MQIETAEIDKIISDAVNFPIKVKSKSESVAQSMIKSIRWVQNAVKKCLDNIASFVSLSIVQILMLKMPFEKKFHLTLFLQDQSAMIDLVACLMMG